MISRLALIITLVVIFSCSSPEKVKVVNDLTHDKRYLILTADDFGASKSINEGIRLAAEHNAITSISALSNFTESLPELVEISENYQTVGIGIHLNIVTGKPVLKKEDVPSLVNSVGDFYTIEELLPRIKKISLDELRKELRAQIIVLQDHNVKIDHLSDQNGILSFYTPFFEVLIELADEFNIPLRSPMFAGVKYPKVFTNKEMKKRFRKLAWKCARTAPFKAIHLIQYSKVDVMEEKLRVLDENGIVHPDFLVESVWGDPSASNLLHVLRNLPAGTSEIILHFGINSHSEEYPSGLDLDYLVKREYELVTLTSGYLNDYYNQLNIQRIGYSDLKDKKDYLEEIK